MGPEPWERAAALSREVMLWRRSESKCISRRVPVGPEPRVSFVGGARRVFIYLKRTLTAQRLELDLAISPWIPRAGSVWLLNKKLFSKRVSKFTSRACEEANTCIFSSKKEWAGACFLFL